MRAVRLYADWKPRKDYVPTKKDIKGKLTYLGSKVWNSPRVAIEDVKEPKPGPDDVIIDVGACGICGSDVHMAQADGSGYIWYPGLTAFPCTLGHEFAGTVREAGRNAINRFTNMPYKTGDPVCAEEMLWCGVCKPCADGYPNHCEALQELGFSVDGAYARYVRVNAKYCWSLEPLRNVYSDRDMFLAGSLVEPTSVAYNAVIERGGGIKPGDNVVVLGGGPIGLAAVSILKRAGGANVILSEPSEPRASLGRRMGADYVINPLKENAAERILDLTSGMGAKLYLEATGLPNVVFPTIEHVIWNGRQLNSTVVIVARADAKIPLTGEVFQVRRASVVGSQGHSGHGIFSRVISSMASGMDMTKMITKKISLDNVPENLKMLQNDRTESKITITEFD